MKYAIGFVAVILITVLTFVLIWRGVMNREPEVQPAPLADYALTTTFMRLTIDGAVNTDDEHRAIRITVSRSESRVEILKGYDYEVVDGKSYPSTDEAYSTFLRALDLMNYTKGNNQPEMEDDRGYCPAGKRYIYEIISGSDVEQRYWSASCSSKVGNFEGEAREVRQLFEEQIPDFRKFTKDVDLT